APVRAVHGETPDAAGPGIHFVDRGGEALRSPPVGNMLRLEPAIENQIARGVKNTGGRDCVPGWIHHDIMTCGHSLFSSVCNFFRYASSRSKLCSQKRR